MKFIATVIALAALATAAPSPDSNTSSQCKPGTYACTGDADGWVVCDVTGHFVCAGTCPPKTVCKFLAANGSPYCVPPGFVL
ncbi:hypothetical protein ESCO_006475 [Escovopsis weberi]|uniref:Uncharacterized protein n=1 Tax=Escovopsis weberi TaxID=150374 RepID=A0A0M8N0U7_ESCWE|nr:hypothetical protein ESCO_006475 [Escovopsis weberi]